MDGSKMTRVAQTTILATGSALALMTRALGDHAHAEGKLNKAPDLEHGFHPPALLTYLVLGRSDMPLSSFAAYSLAQKVPTCPPDCVAEVRVLCERVSLSACLFVETGIFLLNWGAEQVIRP